MSRLEGALADADAELEGAYTQLSEAQAEIYALRDEVRPPAGSFPHVASDGRLPAGTRCARCGRPPQAHSRLCSAAQNKPTPGCCCPTAGCGLQ